MRFLLLMMVCFSLHAEPIDFFVSASPGGPMDTVTRKVVEKIEKQSNLQFVIFNKPGAAHTIAYTNVLNSNRPTLIVATSEIEYHEVLNNVTELFNLGYFSNTLFVSEKSGIKNLKQLIDISKKREINFGHGGVGSYSYLAMESICKKTLRCLDVPYKSGSDGMMGLLIGTIDAYALTSYGIKQFLDNDKYVALNNIRLSKEKSWLKLFGKNLSDKDKETIVKVLSSQEQKFYTELGFEK